MNAYQVIDEKNWARAMHCMVFRESVEPAFVDGDTYWTVCGCASKICG